MPTTSTPIVNGTQTPRVRTTSPSPHRDRPHQNQIHRLTPGQRTALAGAIALAVILAGYGAVGSYTTISDKAAQVGVPFPELVPLGIDGGLVGVVILDLVLAWTGNPVAWLRQLARLLTFGTVAANVSAGWPDPISVGLHAAAPLMLLAMVEAGRAVLLRRTGLQAGTARDRIPLARWLLSPYRTWLLWRRMVLWQITNYHNALTVEARLRRARTLLRVHFGRSWKQHAPAEVVWMLNLAPFAEQACADIDALLTAEQFEVPDSETTVDSGDQLDEAIRINNENWAQRSRPASAETLRKHLRVSAARARELTSAVRAMDKAAVGHRPAEALVNGTAGPTDSASQREDEPHQ